MSDQVILSSSPVAPSAAKRWRTEDWIAVVLGFGAYRLLRKGVLQGCKSALANGSQRPPEALPKPQQRCPQPSLAPDVHISNLVQKL